MPLLMHICFDHSSRLERNVYYFEYRAVRFKLIQNKPRKWSNVLLTIVPLKDSSAREEAYSAAGEFLSALSWQNSSSVALQDCGGMGVGDSYRLRQATCRMFTFPQITFTGHTSGYGISPIPEVETEEQRIALTLLREARSSNKVFLSFLLYWQVMEVGGGEPIGWIDRVYRRHPRRVHVTQREVQQLPLDGRRLGEYLYDDCRNAIAHIRRRQGRRPLRLDVAEENRRLSVSARIVQRFAEFYIQDVLRLTRRMYLVRRRGRGFPVFVNEAFLQNNPCVLVRR